MKFVIVSPRQRWGGAIVLHALCKYLSDLGCDTKIFYCGLTYYNKEKPLQFWAKWLVDTAIDTAKLFLSRFIKNERIFSGYIHPPVRGCRRKYLPWVDDDTIVVYPESIFGNFLHAKNVVRWLLYHNQFQENSAEAFGENDLFICYREVFNDPKLNPSCRKVTISYFDLETYRQFHFGERKGKCYVIRKGHDRPDLPKEFDGIIVDKLSEKEKVNVFNHCEYCICYDTQTAYSSIAALCGCISVIVPEEGKTIEDYLSADEESFGVALGFSEEEISYAIQTRHKVKEEFEAENQKSKEEAREFLRICESYFEKDPKN